MLIFFFFQYFKQHCREYFLIFPILNSQWLTSKYSPLFLPSSEGIPLALSAPPNRPDRQISPKSSCLEEKLILIFTTVYVTVRPLYSQQTRLEILREKVKYKAEILMILQDYFLNDDNYGMFVKGYQK